jgi:hypothetical protein
MNFKWMHIIRNIYVGALIFSCYHVYPKRKYKETEEDTLQKIVAYKMKKINIERKNK